MSADLQSLVKELASTEPLSMRSYYETTPYGSGATAGLSYTPIAKWHCWFCGNTELAKDNAWGYVLPAKNFKHADDCLWLRAKILTKNGQAK